MYRQVDVGDAVLPQRKRVDSAAVVFMADCCCCCGFVLVCFAKCMVGDGGGGSVECSKKVIGSALCRTFGLGWFRFGFFFFFF